MFLFLPAVLLALLSASPGGAQGVSTNDPFRAIAVTVTKPASPPVCCLKALTPLEPLDNEVLLSFEDWKKKQQAAQQEEFLKETVGSDQTGVAEGNASNAGTRNAAAPLDSNASIDYVSGSLQPTDIAPHFRVPITDRFNYANTDCSARVHTSHRSAKSSWSILSSKKDRYMLSPCNSRREKQFVVVELCDDIRIDTVQMANFEFFSGVFKDFTVSVAKTYSIDPDGWAFAGSYRAKNVRGVQSFHPPTSLRDFYRFIRIDFLSHYGNEYYCPISLLRVYGLTHLEEWKWDIWQAESRAKSEKGAVSAVQVVSISPPLGDIPTVSTGNPDDKFSHSVVEPTTTGAIIAHETEAPSTKTASDASFARIPSAITTQSSIQSDSPDSNALHGTIESSLIPSGSSQPSISTQSPSRSESKLQSSTSTSNLSAPTSVIPHASVAESPLRTHEPIASSSSDSHQQAQVQALNHTINGSSSAIITSHSSIPSVYASHPIVQAQSPPPVPHAGESIYRTIMNRLTAIENNQTLYMKYVEQQNGAIRDVIRRLGEDVGRLEGITRFQGMALQKAVNDWEKQRYQLQMEYKDILGRMEILTHEIILEKRLGVAQLCLLLAVIIFLGLTRGSRANESFPIGQGSSRNVKTGGLREWRRHLSWTGGETVKEATDGGKGNEGQNRSRDRINLETKQHIKRPKPLVLGPSTANNLPRAYAGGAENLRLPFPSSEPPHTTTGDSMGRPRTRTHSRSREGSGTVTPLFSAPIAGSGHGLSRRMTVQRPLTPISKSHFVFRTPQGIQRSQSFSRSTTPTGTPGGPVKGPTLLPVSQTSSWGVVPKSAKHWARTAHLHDVKSAKKRREQERIELVRTAGKNKREDRETDVEDGDVFLGSSKKRPSNTALMHFGDVPDVMSSEPSLLLGLVQDIDLHKTEPLVLPVEDDAWVDTDSAASVDGSPILRTSRCTDALAP